MQLSPNNYLIISLNYHWGLAKSYSQEKWNNPTDTTDYNLAILQPMQVCASCK